MIIYWQKVARDFTLSVFSSVQCYLTQMFFYSVANCVCMHGSRPWILNLSTCLEISDWGYIYNWFKTCTFIIIYMLYIHVCIWYICSPAVIVRVDNIPAVWVVLGFPAYQKWWLSHMPWFLTFLLFEVIHRNVVKVAKLHTPPLNICT